MTKRLFTAVSEKKVYARAFLLMVNNVNLTFLYITGTKIGTKSNISLPPFPVLLFLIYWVFLFLPRQFHTPENFKIKTTYASRDKNYCEMKWTTKYYSLSFSITHYKAISCQFRNFTKILRKTIIVRILRTLYETLRNFENNHFSDITKANGKTTN